MQVESETINAPDSLEPAWQTAIWAYNGGHRIRRFNLKDSDGAKNIRNFLVWASRSNTAVVLVPRFVKSEEAAGEIERVKHVISAQ